MRFSVFGLAARIGPLYTPRAKLTELCVAILLTVLFSCVSATAVLP
jgi:hypothetical protein